VAISPLRPANCGFTVAWSDIFRDRFEGHPLKGAALSFGRHTLRGEAMITRAGLEGGAIYALSADVREAIIKFGTATLRIALRPDLDTGELVARLSSPRGKQSFLQLAAQNSASFAGRHRPVAGGGDAIRCFAGLAAGGKPCGIDQRHPP
jgi:predicted flavoprotein YhiN